MGWFSSCTIRTTETGPGLVLIEGGTFVMGRVEQDACFTIGIIFQEE